jgi:hypothetical protein
MSCKGGGSTQVHGRQPSSIERRDFKLVSSLNFQSARMKHPRVIFMHRKKRKKKYPHFT